MFCFKMKYKRVIAKTHEKKKKKKKKIKKDI